MKTTHYLFILWAALWQPVLPSVRGAMRPAPGVAFVDVGVSRPDSASVVRVDATLLIPEGYLTRRSRLVLRPMLMQGDSLLTSCPPVVLDAPLAARKLLRARLLDGTADTLAPYARRVIPSRRAGIPCTFRIPLPANGCWGRVVALLSTHACGACGRRDTLEIARLSDFASLLPEGPLRLVWMNPRSGARPKAVRGCGEVRLHFPIACSGIDPSLSDNRRELERLLVSLRAILADSLMTLDTLTIEGVASADGPCAANAVLARRRADAVREWLTARLDLTPEELGRIRTDSRPEGWEPVLAAMQADGHPDAPAVAAVLADTSGEDDDAAERRIRRLRCWPGIRDRYLQRDRRVICAYACELRGSTTDGELLRRYAERPETFDESELLRVAALERSPERQLAVCEYLLRRFPQSDAAANNLAILLLRAERADEALSAVSSSGSPAPELLNTKAVILLRKGDADAALSLLAAADTLPAARYNRGVLLASRRDYEAARRLLAGFGGPDAALAALACGCNDEAAAAMSASDDTSPRAEYVRALIAARQGDRESVLTHLSRAVAERRFAIRARIEPDFGSCASLPDFIELTNCGSKDEPTR